MFPKLTWPGYYIPAFLLGNLLFYSMMTGPLDGVFMALFPLISAGVNLIVMAGEPVFSGAKSVFNLLKALVMSPLFVIGAAAYVGFSIREFRLWKDPKNLGSATLCGVVSFVSVAIGLNVILNGWVLAIFLFMTANALREIVKQDKKENLEKSDKKEKIFTLAFLTIGGVFVLVSLNELMDEDHDFRKTYAGIEYSMNMTDGEREKMDAALREGILKRKGTDSPLLKVMAFSSEDILAQTPESLSFRGINSSFRLVNDSALICTLDGDEIKVTETQGDREKTPSIAETLVAQSLCVRHLTPAKS